jgi:hypothetical protein
MRLYVTPITAGRRVPSYIDNRTPRIGGTVSVAFINRTSRVAIAGHVAERRRPHEWNELTILGDYHLPFGKAEARAEAAKWLCQV